MIHPEIEPLRERLVQARAHYNGAPLRSPTRDRAWESLLAAINAFNVKRGELIRDLGLDAM